MQTKVCSKCKKEKPISEFNKNKQNHNRPNSWCKQCYRDGSARFRNTPKGVYQNLKGQIKYAKNHKGAKNNKGYIKPQRKDLFCTQDEFVEWYETQPKICGYCGVKEDEMASMSDSFNKKLTRLSIDVVDNARGYSIDNMMLCCRRCNITKSNFFTRDEMFEIGKIIKRHWDKERKK